MKIMSVLSRTAKLRKETDTRISIHMIEAFHIFLYPTPSKEVILFKPKSTLATFDSYPAYPD